MHITEEVTKANQMIGMIIHTSSHRSLPNDKVCLHLNIQMPYEDKLKWEPPLGQFCGIDIIMILRCISVDNILRIKTKFIWFKSNKHWEILCAMLPGSQPHSKT